MDFNQDAEATNKWMKLQFLYIMLNRNVLILPRFNPNLGYLPWYLCEDPHHFEYYNLGNTSQYACCICLPNILSKKNILGFILQSTPPYSWLYIAVIKD